MALLSSTAMQGKSRRWMSCPRPDQRSLIRLSTQATTRATDGLTPWRTRSHPLIGLDLLLLSDSDGRRTKRAGKCTEWLVHTLNNEASHGLCLSKVELHGFASNGTFLLRGEVNLHSPSGDNASCMSNGASYGAWEIRTVAGGSPLPTVQASRRR